MIVKKRAKDAMLVNVRKEGKRNNVTQVKHAEAAQLVMEPVTAAVMPIYPAKVVNIFNI